MRINKLVIGTLLAVVVAASPLGTTLAFAQEVAVETATEESVEVVEEVSYVEVSNAAAEEVSNTTAEEVNEIASEEVYEAASEEVTGGEVSNIESENNISNSCEGTISDNTTVILRGVPEGDEQETISAIDEYLPKIMETGNKLNINNPGFVDAEKYNNETKGYDSYHCWAATASNILWTTGYAQKAINPMTNEAFKSEDEILTYFSENFTDDPGDPQEAVEWFFNGTYTMNDVKNVAHTKSDDSNGLLKDVKHDSYLVSVFNDAREMKKIYDIASNGIGVLVRWLKTDENGKQALSANGHWVTANGIVMDNEQSSVYDKLKAIIIADSDTAPVNGDLSASAGEKTNAKSEQNNTYTVYKLTFNEDLGVWGINNFYNGFGVITHLFGLLNSDKTATGAKQSDAENSMGGSAKDIPVEVQAYVDMINNGEIKVDTTDKEFYVAFETVNDSADDSAVAQNSAFDKEVDKMIISELTEKDLMKIENIEMLREYMIKNNMSAFVVNNGKVDANKNCAVYVNAADTMIYNLTVDGENVPFKSYKIVDTKANVAKIVIDKEYMGNLSNGTHSVQISVENWESPIEIEIEVM